MTHDQLAEITAQNLVNVIDETRPNSVELLDLLQSELRKLLKTESTYWLGIRLPERWDQWLTKRGAVVQPGRAPFRRVRRANK